MYLLDLQSRIPIYKQVYENVKNMILNGELSAGDKLPSVRELAKELGVNPNTITKAFQELEKDKIIYTVPGRGSYASDIIDGKLLSQALSDFDGSVRLCLRLKIPQEKLKERITVIGEQGDKNDNSE